MLLLSRSAFISSTSNKKISKYTPLTSKSASGLHYQPNASMSKGFTKCSNHSENQEKATSPLSTKLNESQIKRISQLRRFLNKIHIVPRMENKVLLTNFHYLEHSTRILIRTFSTQKQSTSQTIQFMLFWSCLQEKLFSRRFKIEKEILIQNRQKPS